MLGRRSKDIIHLIPEPFYHGNDLSLFVNVPFLDPCLPLPIGKHSKHQRQDCLRTLQSQYSYFKAKLWTNRNVSGAERRFAPKIRLVDQDLVQDKVKEEYFQVCVLSLPPLSPRTLSPGPPHRDLEAFCLQLRPIRHDHVRSSLRRHVLRMVETIVLEGGIDGVVYNT